MSLVAFDFDETLPQSGQTILLGKEYDVASEIRGLAEQGLCGNVKPRSEFPSSRSTATSS
ncbi:hypothetical protein [Halomicrococcus sp. NG-SE-24]|uniref:hypothetical protein n=1 Tax=Halomicrococcus sp. NG-SE-24 TaxID=3436928 RepID=UPI003D959D09